MLPAALRFILIAVGVLTIGSGAALWALSADERLLASLGLVAIGALVAAVAVLIRVTPGAAPPDPEDVRRLSAARQRELIRGTSLFLRESNFRYSVRTDSRAGAERRAFNAEVNTVRLGFLPAAITDNTNEREGFGYVAFVYDGRRWCGPGLPCPADQSDAVRHAARCVSPLASEEETRFESTGS